MGESLPGEDCFSSRDAFDPDIAGIGVRALGLPSKPIKGRPFDTVV
jgi:hypothetical protein